MNGLNFKVKYNSLKTTEFREIYAKGDKFVTPYFVLFVLHGKEEFKAGVVASKKIGKAVKRNRAKRRLREIIRLSQHEIPKNTWIVMVARYGILDVDFKKAKKIFIKLLNENIKAN